MIGQEIGLYFLMPLAIETLTDNIFAEGDYYEGDLLKNVLEVNTKFWDDNKNYWKQRNDLENSIDKLRRLYASTTK